MLSNNKKNEEKSEKYKNLLKLRSQLKENKLEKGEEKTIPKQNYRKWRIK